MLTDTEIEQTTQFHYGDCGARTNRTHGVRAKWIRAGVTQVSGTGEYMIPLIRTVNGIIHRRELRERDLDFCMFHPSNRCPEREGRPSVRRIRRAIAADNITTLIAEDVKLLCTALELVGKPLPEETGYTSASPFQPPTVDDAIDDAITRIAEQIRSKPARRTRQPKETYNGTLF